MMIMRQALISKQVKRLPMIKILGKYVNMFQDGIVDSFQTVKTTLDDACSVGIFIKIN
jgi:hypothetical protein